MKVVVVLLITFSVFAIGGLDPVRAQTTMLGGTGLLRVQSAETLVPGELYITAHALSFFEARGASMLAKNFTVNTSLTFDISEVFELTAGLTVFQDDNVRLYPIPGDSRLGLKINAVRGSVFRFGLYPFFSFPTAEHHNVPYEPYSSDKVGLGLMGITTLDLKDTFPVVPLKGYLNVGYMDHDLSDQFFASKIDQALLGVGIKVPVRSAVLFTEYTAELFVNHSEVRWYENSQRVTQGVRFIGPFDLVCDVGADIGVSRFSGEADDFHKRYADWKVFFGVTHRVTVFPYLDSNVRRARQQELEDAREAERIRQQREKAAKDLEEMKKQLEKPEKP